MTHLAALLLALVPVPAPAPMPSPAPPPEGSAPAPDPYATIAYDPLADAASLIDLQFARARVSGKRVLIVMGYNGCHDSGWLANLIEKPRFQTLILDHFELAYVDVAMPQLGRGRNAEVARRLGFKKLKGTPTVAVLDADGRLLNKKQAPTWRNVSTWSEDATYDALAAYAAPRVPAK